MNHGTRASYLRGCRCQDCYDANRRYCKTYRLHTNVQTTRGPGQYLPTRPMRVPSDPTVTHLAALLASGWTQAQIVRETGLNSGYLSRLVRGRFPTVHRRVAATLAGLEPYAPVGIDEMAVERLIRGELDWRACTRAERVEAARRMDAAGMVRLEVARRVHLNSIVLYGEVYREGSS